MIDTGLKNKVVVVTGANHGIGAATARAFAEQGAAVFVHYLRLEHLSEITRTPGDTEVPGLAKHFQNQTQSGETVAESIRSAGGKAVSWEADLSEPGNVTELFDRAVDAFGQVDVLVNNAAHWEADSFVPPTSDPTCPVAKALSTGFSTVSAETHDRHFAVNCRAVALMMAEFLRRHIERGASWGRIINVSTDGAYCFPGEVSYGASKFALEGYTRSAAKEMGKYGITVNILSPGPIQTGYISRELEEQILPNTPLGRLGYPEDVADVIVFLASEQARWVSGQLIHVGGGHRM